MNNEKWLYRGSLCLILLLSAIVFSYNLGGRDFREDEFQVTEAAAGYYYTGDFCRWDWIAKRAKSPEEGWSDAFYYDRAWPHTFLVAKSYSLFGISEASSRLISVLFSVLLVYISYFFTVFFIGKKDVALAVALSLSLSPSVIDFAQYARMYAFLLPIFMLFTWTLFRGLTEQLPLRTETGIQGFIGKNLNFHYGYLLIAGVLLVFNYLIHINSLILLPAAYVFILYLTVATKERRYFNLSIMGVLAIGAVLFVEVNGLGNDKVRWMLREIGQWLSFFAHTKYVYLKYLAGFPFPAKIGIGLLLFGFLEIFFLNESKFKTRRIFLYILVVITCIFFIYIAGWFASYRYVIHVMPMALILILTSYFFIFSLLKSKKIKIIACGLLAACLIYSYSNKFNSIYGTENDRGLFSVAYATIEDRFKPGEDVIFGQLLHGYYLQNLPPAVKCIDMLNNGEYSLKQFQEDISLEKSGYITWETRKGFHLQNDLKKYINENYLHLHGKGIDDTKVEVYYFTNKSK